MKGQRRYYSEEEILTRIDRCYIKAAKGKADAAELERSITVFKEQFLKDSPQPTDREQSAHAAHIKDLRELQEKRLQYAENQINKTARRLKDRLAMMRTKILPFGVRDSNNLRATDMSVPQ